jgi:peptidoglycan-associated lipoprotein
VKQPVEKIETAKIEPAKSADSAAAKPQAALSALETVYFDFDKSDLRQDARNVLSKNAEILLKSKQGAKVKVEGHCDERGSAEYNLALGERRAKSALHYLLTLGVQADRLSIISYGKEKPAVQGTDEAAWAKNRRAEFVIEK